MMKRNVADISHCEEQLRTTLHCDDKEKLRSKLSLLQREYVRTAQRLQRAERAEAMHRHVSSRITQQHHQDQRDPEITSNPCLQSSLTTLSGSTERTVLGLNQEDTGGPTDSEKTKRTQVKRFLLPSDGPSPQTDVCHDAVRGQRPSPSLRLRSRRSRLRWERRSAEAGMNADISDDVLEQSERMETAVTQKSQGRVKKDGSEAVNGSEELFSASESESPSLLLTHWNTFGQTKTGYLEEREIKEGQKLSEEETEVRCEENKGSELMVQTEGRGQHGSENKNKKEKDGGQKGDINVKQNDGRLCEDSTNNNTEQKATEQIESKKLCDNALEIKEEKIGLGAVERDVKGAGIQDSCTLVEGLLFPAEYYIRTTRRMTSSQSQPDMQAFIVSQLSIGRRRRSQGRGRGLNRTTRSDKHVDQDCQKDFSSPISELPSVGPHVESPLANTSVELNRHYSSEISDQISACQIHKDTYISPKIIRTRPSRGRRKRRGRGRGRPPTLQSSDTHQLCTQCLGQNSDDHQPTSSSVSSSLSLHGAQVLKPCLTLGDSVPDNTKPVSTPSTATQASSGGNVAQVGSSSGHPVYPIFLKSSSRTDRSTQMSRSDDTCHDLLLPFSPPPAKTSMPPLCSSLSLTALVRNLVNFDLPQDFHLPDDQFASLKLNKLRQVALESGNDIFASPSYNTRRSIRRYESFHSSNNVMIPLSLPLSLTPTTSFSLDPTGAKQTGEQLSEIRHPEHQNSEESVTVVQDCAANCVDRYEEKQTVMLINGSQSSISVSSKHRSIDQSFKPQSNINFVDRPIVKNNDFFISQSNGLKGPFDISSVNQTGRPGVVHPVEEQRSPNHHKEDEVDMKTLCSDCLLNKTCGESFCNCMAVQACNDSEGPGESPVQHLNVKPLAKESREYSESTMGLPIENRNQDKCLPSPSVHSHFPFSPNLASAPFIIPHLDSSPPPSSLILPTLGMTPLHEPGALPVTSSPSAPALILPPPHSPSTQALSPPTLSPCPFITSFSSPCQRPFPPTGQIPASFVLSQGEELEEHIMRCTRTLKTPAGGCLVDACCLTGSSGGLYLAAAGKWAVCLWSQNSASDWSLIHTWTFNEPVINVFAVPDAAGLICVALGQLEIRKVRVLSCSSFFQAPLCVGLVQAVVGVPMSRVVTSSYSASVSTLQVFTLSDSGSTLTSQPLAPPGACVGALAPVDGLRDAVIGTDEGGHLFVWNLRTGQLLKKIIFGDGLSHTACLRGYSDSGVLFVLLQHHLLSSLEKEENQAAETDQKFSEEGNNEETKKETLLSLVAVNPLTGKSVLAIRLYPPKSWSGRLCEADTNSCSVVGLSQSGCVCVWELRCRGASRMVRSPENEGWQLARWGGTGVLLTGHHSGDVTLHCYSREYLWPRLMTPLMSL